MVLAEIEHLIQQYGYIMMTIGALVEGETFLIAGGIAASQGLLHLPLLILLAFVGSTIHDGIFFFLGRYAGHRVFDARPAWKDKIQRILNLFERYGVLLILALRFAYGLRTLIPAAIGMTPFSKFKFFAWDMVGGVIWSCLFVLGGYIFGEMIVQLMGSVDHYQAVIFRSLLAIVIAGIFIFIMTKLFLYRRKIRRAKREAAKNQGA